MSARNPFGHIFLTTIAAAALGVFAFHMTDLLTLNFKGIPVQGTAHTLLPEKDDRIEYRYTVDGKDYRTGTGLLVPVTRVPDGQAVALRYLKNDPSKAMNTDDFVQAMTETGIGMLIALAALGLLGWRAARAAKRQ